VSSRIWGCGPGIYVLYSLPIDYTILNGGIERESSHCSCMADQDGRSVGVHFIELQATMRAGQSIGTRSVAWWAGTGAVLVGQARQCVGGPC
jgi:hypothetical protein